MKKTIRLTESELVLLVKRIINESAEGADGLIDNLKNKYNISLWDLLALETIAGTPNFSRKAMGGRYYWQLKASYLTRLRL